MKQLRYKILFLLVWMFSHLATAQLDVLSALDSTQFLIGDQMKLHLTASHPEGGRIVDVDIKKLEETPEIEVINSGTWDTLKNGNLLTIKKDILFTVFDSGAYFIPSIPFVYEQNGQTATESTNELLVEVLVPQQDSVFLAPIKPIITEPLKLEDFYPYFLALFFVALIGGIIYYFIHRQRHKELPPPPEIKIPAHDMALDQLEKLKKAKLWQQGFIKQYQSKLTFIIREYLENRYGIQALESTTYEILQDLKPINLSEDWNTRLREMLQLADLVKFAKAEPPIEAHDRLMGYAEAFVQETKEKPVLNDPENVNQSS